MDRQRDDGGDRGAAGAHGAGPAALPAADAAPSRREIAGGGLRPRASRCRASAGWPQALGLSRVTVRKALDGLVAAGLVTRRHGARTEVNARVEKALSSLTSFSEDMLARGLAPGFRWISRELVRPSPAEATALGLAADAQVWRLARVRTGDGRPIAREVSTVPARFLDSARPDRRLALPHASPRAAPRRCARAAAARGAARRRGPRATSTAPATRRSSRSSAAASSTPARSSSSAAAATARTSTTSSSSCADRTSAAPAARKLVAYWYGLGHARSRAPGSAALGSQPSRPQPDRVLPAGARRADGPRRHRRRASRWRRSPAARPGCGSRAPPTSRRCAPRPTPRSSASSSATSPTARCASPPTSPTCVALAAAGADIVAFDATRAAAPDRRSPTSSRAIRATGAARHGRLRRRRRTARAALAAGAEILGSTLSGYTGGADAGRARPRPRRGAAPR